MQDIFDLFGNVHGLLIDAISHIPRLSVRFKLKSASCVVPYSEAIGSDAEFWEIQSNIMNELAKCQSEMSAYIDQWTPFCTIWQFDRAVFMRLFGASGGTAAVHFAKNINQFMDISNQISIREISLAVHFLSLNASQLQKQILDEVDEWQMKYLELLKTKTDGRIAKLFEYIAENGYRVAEPPENVDDLHRLCATYENLMHSIDHWKVELAEMVNNFEVLRRCKMISDNEFSNMKERITIQWNTYLDKLTEADEVLDDAKNRFKLVFRNVSLRDSR